MISQLICLTRSDSPSAGLLPNSSRRTVSPIMQTAAPARCSASENSRPWASVQLPMPSHSLVLPVMVLAQLRPLATSVPPVRDWGAAAATPPIWVAMASASPSLKKGALELPLPGPMRWPGRSCNRLVPSPEIWFCTDTVAPLPTVTMVMTALTPITMPRMVRKERIRLRRIERKASRSVLSHMVSPLPWPWPRVRPAARPGPGCARRWRPRRRRSARCAARRRPSRLRA